MVTEAVDTYVDAVIQFGTDLQQDGVDLMIAELVRVSAIWLGVQEQGDLMDRLQAALDESDNEVLKLRLRVTMAKMDYTEIDLGKRLIKELPNLDNASPPVLAAICEASFEMQDYSRAKELLDIFVNKFEESDYVRAAYKLRAFGQFEDRDFEGALKTIDEAQGTYGHDRDVVWAQLMKAQILLEQGDVDAAREANMYVRNERNWRGEPVAQATYQLGQVEEAAGNDRTAFGFYQRTYVQFKGYASGYWAAESYLASARILEKLGMPGERMNTYKAMLLDRYVNELPQAEIARKALGSSEVAEIENMISAGVKTNILIQVEDVQMIDTTLTNAAAAAETPADEEAGDDPPEETAGSEPSAEDSDAVETEGE
jgi:tetratricopeptide (TPR) repeat protein